MFYAFGSGDKQPLSSEVIFIYYLLKYIFLVIKGSSEDSGNASE
jgi:hypothetical protein